MNNQYQIAQLLLALREYLAALKLEEAKIPDPTQRKAIGYLRHQIQGAVVDIANANRI